jgi:hypothetical protein
MKFDADTPTGSRPDSVTSGTNPDASGVGIGDEVGPGDCAQPATVSATAKARSAEMRDRTIFSVQ